MPLNHPELTQKAMNILRNPEVFEWYLIPMLAFVIYIYFNEISKKNWKGVAAGLSLYSVHWFCEIINALIQRFSGHALWTVPAGTGYLLLVGVGAEISMMFSVSGLILSKVLPEDRGLKIAGINNRVLFVVGNAAFFSIFELFLVTTPTFHWVYSWWGAFPVFITVYIPFFAAAVVAYDAKPKSQIIWISSVALVDAIMMALFAGCLHWI